MRLTERTGVSDSDDATQKPAPLGKSALLVNAIGIVAVIFATILLWLSRGPDTENTQAFNAFGGVSLAVFMVTWIWSIMLAVRSANANEDPFWENTICLVAMIEVLAVLSRLL